MQKVENLVLKEKECLRKSQFSRVYLKKVDIDCEKA